MRLHAPFIALPLSDRTGRAGRQRQARTVRRAVAGCRAVRYSVDVHAGSQDPRLQGPEWTRNMEDTTERMAWNTREEKHT